MPKTLSEETKELTEQYNYGCISYEEMKLKLAEIVFRAEDMQQLTEINRVLNDNLEV